jgi:hypothetical protein
MSRSGDDMVRELTKLLGNDSVVKTASTKEEEKKELCKKCDKEDCACDGEEKKDTEKKASVLLSVVNDLTKLATELDEAGADVASGLVDDALQIIVKNLQAKAHFDGSEHDEAAELNINEEDPTEAFEEELPVDLQEEGMGSRMEPKIEGLDGQAQEGLDMTDISEEKLESILRDPKTWEMLRGDK